MDGLVEYDEATVTAVNAKNRQREHYHCDISTEVMQYIE